MRFILFLILFLLSAVVPAAEIRGKVTRVSDGDTLTVIDDLDGGKFKVRIYGIDAPEKNQAFGGKAKDYLAEMVLKKSAVIRYKEIDRYGRIIGKVYISGRDIGLAMLQSGFAWLYDSFSKDQEYAAAEKSARCYGRGLWKDKKPVPPWIFRRHNKNIQR